MLVKNQYQGETDRRAGHGALCYQIRQAFPHGEVTAEEANRIGYETAMRWTKGKYQFFVCTHIDKEHIHNHIYYNSTAYDRSRKFRNFIGSSFALRRLSDRVCLEHDLSVIANPKLHSKGRYLHYGQWLGENQKLSQKEQIRLAIDAALTERPKDFADFLRRMETAGIQVKHGRGEKFVNQIALRAHHFDAVIARFTRQLGAAGKIIDKRKDLIVAQFMGRKTVDRRL